MELAKSSRFIRELIYIIVPASDDQPCWPSADASLREMILDVALHRKHAQF